MFMLLHQLKTGSGKALGALQEHVEALVPNACGILIGIKDCMTPSHQRNIIALGCVPADSCLQIHGL